MCRQAVILASLAVLSMTSACAEKEPDELIIGSWVIDEAAQREEIAGVSPTDLEDFDEAFRQNLESIRETFHRDGRYEITNTLGGPFDDHWELVSKSRNSVVIRSSGHSWVSRGPNIAAGRRGLSPSVLAYNFNDEDHMYVTVTMPISGEGREISFFFVRDE
jgi:hypothetical protein